MRIKFVAAGAFFLLAAPAYPQNKDMLQLQRDMIYLQQAVKQLQTTVDQNNATIKGLVEKMADQVNTLAGGMQKITQSVDGMKSQNDAGTKEMRATLATINSAVTEIQEGVSSMRAQVNSVSRELTTLKTTSEPLAGPNELWRTAYLDYFAGNYELAVSGFQEFLSKFANDPRAPEAHLLLGDALSAQKKYEPALAEYDFVLQKFPESDKTRAALLKKGLALAVANQPQQAIATLNDVVKKFPNTSEANSASTKLRELQAGQRRTTPAPAR